MTGRKILVLGGGFGGAAAARTARALLDREHQVTLVDHDRRTYLCGSFPLLIVGERQPAKVSRSLGSLANRGIEYIQAEIKSIDAGSRRVATSVGKMDCDFLVLAMGAGYDWSAVPGSADAFSFYDLENAKRLRGTLSALRGGRIVIAVASLPYKCPPAPYEAAMVIDWSLRQRGVRDKMEIDVYTPEPVPLPVAGPEAATRLSRALDRRGIRLHTEAAVDAVSEGGHQVSFTDGTSLEAQLAITIPAHRAPPVISAAGLTGDSGWVTVAPQTLETSFDGVYAVGDINEVQMANGRPMPKAGVMASAEGEVVGQNIAASINGSAPVTFRGEGHCYIAYGGTQSGVVQGQFLAPGRPQVKFQPPTARRYRSKERFERQWRRFRI